MKTELRDALENLYPDSEVRDPPVRRLRLDVARGGTVAVHLLAEGLMPGETVTLSVTEAGRPVPEARWFRLVDVPVEQNTGRIAFTEKSMPNHDPPNAPNPYVVRRAPFRTYDALEPLPEGATRASAPTLAFRLQVPVPRDTRPGPRRFVLQIRHSGQAVELHLGVRVWRAVIPEVGPASFPVTNWFSYENIATRHGLRPWSESHWRMLEAYARLMAHGRQNTFWIPLPVIFPRDERQRLHLDRARLERIVRLFTRANLHYIEGGHVAARTGGRWDAPTFSLTLKGFLATSPDGNDELAAVGRQLSEVIEHHRWQHRWIQHVADEPIQANAADYRILVGMVRKYWPRVPILDATMDTSLVGSVDIWCPQVHKYQRHREAFERQRALGDRVWYYTCCSPGGPWLNRLLDQELLRPVLLGWGGAFYQLNGFLHWGLNHYQKDQDPWQQSVIERWGGTSNALPAGDTHVVYPGPDGPWSSLRWEAHREGWEDLELLQRLQRERLHAAARVLARAIQGFDRYVRSVSEFRAARAALLRALENLPD